MTSIIILQIELSQENSMNKLSDETKQAIQTGIRKKAVYLVLLCFALFLPAGTVQWWQAWVFIGLSVIGVAFEMLVLLPHDPELFAQRSTVQAGTKPWDTIITILSVIVFYLIALVSPDWIFALAGPRPSPSGGTFLALCCYS
jgi:hypothetical protein